MPFVRWTWCKVLFKWTPGYAQAWLVQGWIYWQIAMEGWCDNPDEFRKRTIESYLRAAELDPIHAVAQMEAAAARAVAGDMPGAAASLERALDLGESQPDIQISCANYVASILDDPERAVSIMDHSFELVYRKSSFHSLTELRVCVFSGDYERGAE